MKERRLITPSGLDLVTGWVRHGCFPARVVDFDQASVQYMPFGSLTLSLSNSDYTEVWRSVMYRQSKSGKGNQVINPPSPKGCNFSFILNQAIIILIKCVEKSIDIREVK